MSAITYEFKLENGLTYRFEIDPAMPSQPSDRKHAYWTNLDYHQCANCPLSRDEHRYCPVAIDIEEVAEKFKDILSFENVEVRVVSDQRDYHKNCDAQTGLKSLLGFIMGSGDCPILSHFKPMAEYHLPFATVEETIYRVAGAYLIKQYFLHNDGEDPDLSLEGLNELYQHLQQVNKDFMRRIRAASASDANLNAINNLLSLSTMVAATLIEKLQDMKPLFFRELDAAGLQE